MMSARFRSEAEVATRIATENLSDIFSQKETAFSLSLPNTMTSRMGRTAITPSICVSACAPVPKSASTSASFADSKSVASPEAAPVRRAVRYSASSNARGVPFVPSITITLPWMMGRFLSALLLKTETIFNPKSPNAAEYEGMNNARPEWS